MSRQTCLDPFYYHRVAIFPMSQFNFLPEAMSLRNILRNLSPDFKLSHNYFWLNPVSGKLESLAVYTDAREDAMEYERAEIEAGRPVSLGGPDWKYNS